MTERIPERDLGLVTAAPTDELRAVRGGKSVRVPIVSLPPSAAVQRQIDDLIAGQQAGQLVYRTWAELSAVTGSAGTGAQVVDDTGTHTDPVVGGTVANAGQYVWSGSPAGWRWVREDALPLKADQADLSALEDIVAPIQAAVQGAVSDDLVTFLDGDNNIIGRVQQNAAWDITLKALRAHDGTELLDFDALGDPDRTIFTDAAGRIIGLLAPNKLVTTDGLEIYHYEAIGDDRELVVVDSLGRVIYAPEGGGGSSVEVEAARGSRSDLNTRLSQSLTPYGMPRRHYWGEWYLRETRQRLRKLALEESTQLVIASIGDSWTHSGVRWARPTAVTLKAEYGDAGAGYVSFARITPSLANGNVHANNAVTYTGDWDHSVYFTAYSPDIGQVSSSTPGDKLSYTITGTPSAVNLFANGGAGVVRYRFNGGSWTSVDLSALAAGLHVIQLSTPAAGTFEVEVVSGTPVLFGIDVQQADSGVRWHKLGATGSRASHWAAVDSVQWRSGLAALEPNLVTILLGTNDQPSYDADTYKVHLQSLISRVREALPLADILLIAPCENGRSNARPMASYAAALYELAAVNGCAYLDLQYVFGDDFSQYASTSPRAWFNADLIHPEPQTGGRVIADAVLRLLINL